jgi:ribosomal protein S18 acetylase RimI-like enzyme
MLNISSRSKNLDRREVRTKKRITSLIIYLRCDNDICVEWIRNVRMPPSGEKGEIDSSQLSQMMICREINNTEGKSTSAASVADLETGNQVSEDEDQDEFFENDMNEDDLDDSCITSIRYNNTFAGENLSYRRILPKDRVRIQELHEKWFPVVYQQEFYDNLVLGKLCNTNNPLHTKVICNDEDEIIACLVGMSITGSKLNRASRELLLPDWPYRHSKAFYIMTLGTVTKARNTGLASSLVTECIDNIVQSNSEYGALYLHVITTNQSAIRFYERLNFWRVQEIKSK